MEKKFNLLTEPWIRVLDENGVLKEVSILEALRDAHRFKKLAGELPTQDVALLRLLLAILYCVFTRQDANGQEKSFKDEDAALERWQSLWQNGALPFAPINEYLDYYKDNFYLFHPERPFYQVAGLNRGTEYEAAKLNGMLAESGDKIRLFANRSGSGKKSLTYAEAARWLLHLNGFDDASGKPSVRKQNLPSTGVGYLGKLGLVYATGNNLFETLMLNLVFYPHPDETGTGQAVWETETVCADERREIVPPNSQQQLLTLQSRRLLLFDNAEDGTVSGYRLLGGDFFVIENYLGEHMTLWRKNTTKTREVIQPKPHGKAKAFWRDFGALMGKTTAHSTEKAGIAKWVERLSERKLINKHMVYFQIASAEYDTKNCSIINIFGDSVAINASLLKSRNANWIVRIVDGLEVTRQCVSALKRFAEDLESTRGYRKDPKKAAVIATASQAESEAYFNLDMPFRHWLMSIEPGTDIEEARIIEWYEEIRKLLLNQARELLRQTDDRALTGKLPQPGEKPDANNAFQAYTKFKNIINKLTCFKKGGGADGR